MATPAEIDGRTLTPNEKTMRASLATEKRWSLRAVVFASSFLLCFPTAISLVRYLGERHRSQLDALVDRLLDLDARARSAATLGTPILVGIDHDAHKVVATKDLGGGEVASVVLPPGVDASFSAKDAPPPQLLRFDCDGRTADYELDLRSCSDAIRISVVGLTGWAKREGVSP